MNGQPSRPLSNRAAADGSSARTTPQPWWDSDCFFILLLLAATILAYQPVWHAGFLTDDKAFLELNTLMPKHDGWWRVWLDSSVDYVPLTTTSFWLEWQMWAAHPLGYHLDNVLLHALNAMLIWQILRKLKIPGARLASAIFALHPVNVASVAWISERKNTLAMAFYAAALLCYLIFEDSGKKRWYWIAAGAFVLGVFSKTAIAPLPLVLLGMAWWRRGLITSIDIRRALLFFGLAAAAGALAIWIQHSVSHAYVVRPESFGARLAGAGWAFWFYLGKALWPQNLIFMYPKWQINPRNPLSYVPDLLILAMLGVCWFYRKGWGRPLLFGFGYFLVMLLPVLGLVDISFMRATLVADHWQYFAIIGPIALAAAGLAKWLAGWVQGLRYAALLAVLGVLVWMQSSIYVDAYTFWHATVERNPGSLFAQSAYGNTLFQKGRVKEAIAHYQIALELGPGLFDAHYDLGNIYLQEGQPLAAVFHYRKALEIMPDNDRTLNNLAWVLATCPDASVRNGNEAVQLARRAVKITKGKAPSVIGTLAAAYAEAGHFPEAVAVAKQALQLAGTPKDRGLKKDLEQQLELYQRRLPYRDMTQVATSSGNQR